MIFWGKKSQTFMIPIYSTTVLYDNASLAVTTSNEAQVHKDQEKMCKDTTST